MTGSDRMRTKEEHEIEYYVGRTQNKVPESFATLSVIAGLFRKVGVSAKRRSFAIVVHIYSR